jgi:hypothetical protein
MLVEESYDVAVHNEKLAVVVCEVVVDVITVDVVLKRKTTQGCTHTVITYQFQHRIDVMQKISNDR